MRKAMEMFVSFAITKMDKMDARKNYDRTDKENFNRRR